MVHPEVAALDARFSADEFLRRRDAVRARLRAEGGGIALIPANPTTWRNADNPHPFRQSSHLLYLTGLTRPGIALVLDADNDADLLFGPPEDPDDVVWHGPHPALRDEATAAGLTDLRDIAELPQLLREQMGEMGAVHVPPAFMPAQQMQLAAWLNVPTGEVKEKDSDVLAQVLGDLRLVKSEAEVAEIERAVGVSAEMYAEALRLVRPGITERALRAAMERVAREHGMPLSFGPIVTVRGEVLHNEGQPNTLEDGQLVLLDTGVETEHGYASDITRTFPVSGRFSDEQRAVYETVLRAQEDVIGAMRPGVNFRDLHLRAARVIAEGLVEIGLMRGDPEAAVAAGAHALFFVHGLGHPLGLDVHDVHDLGDAVAYPPDAPRSEQFGLAYLRFGRDLEAGMVMTVEPGVYFIPALIDRWRGEGRHTEFVDYDAVEAYRGFGGIRIEDDVLVTARGARVLGPGIPKAPDEVEAAMAQGAA